MTSCDVTVHVCVCHSVCNDVSVISMACFDGCLLVASWDKDELNRYGSKVLA